MNCKAQFPCVEPGSVNCICIDPKSRKERVYIAGPMTGKPDFNYPAFFAARDRWKEVGCDVLCPAENFGGDTTRNYREYIRADLAMLLEADAIVMLPGWEESKGARFELHVAQLLGLRIYVDAVSVSCEAETPIVATVLCSGVRIDEPPPPAETILEEAQRLVHGDRGKAYGHPILDYERTGRIWGAILGLPDIDPRLCCLMMAGVKISREVNAPRRDNRTDLAGYAECADMVATEQERRARG